MRVHFQVIEGQRRRIQVFEGIVIKRQGAGVRETFTVRKQSFGVGVERTFPLHSPKIEKIEVAAIGDVNRAKLYYLRGKVGKKARVREMRGRAPARRRAAPTVRAPSAAAGRACRAQLRATRPPTGPRPKRPRSSRRARHASAARDPAEQPTARGSRSPEACTASEKPSRRVSSACAPTACRSSSPP